MDQVTALSVGEETEKQWFRKWKSEDLSVSSQGIYLHGRPGLNSVACMQKLGLWCMPSLSRPQYKSASAGAGREPLKLGSSSHCNVREVDLGADSVGNLWIHLCGTAARAGLLRD